MSATIEGVKGMVPGEEKVAGVSFANDLDTDETIESVTVTATQVRGATDADGLTVDSEAVNTDAATIDGSSVAIGKGVLWLVTVASDAVPGAKWEIEVAVVTDSDPPQTLKERVHVEVI